MGFRVKRRRTPTGFSPETRACITERATDVYGVVRFEVCGEPCSDFEHHHRRARGMGSTRRPETNGAANGLLCCGSDHRYIESHRTLAYDNGWLVKSSQSPTDTPVRRRGIWVLLRDDGSVLPAPPTKLEVI